VSLGGKQERCATGAGSGCQAPAQHVEATALSTAALQFSSAGSKMARTNDRSDDSPGRGPAPPACMC
jgi:hypothetical protein